jgi:hypothetical protein
VRQFLAYACDLLLAAVIAACVYLALSACVENIP